MSIIARVALAAAFVSLLYVMGREFDEEEDEEGNPLGHRLKFPHR
jgi:hypothetical protein